VPAPEGVRWPAIAPMDEYVREILVPVLRGLGARFARLEVRGVSGGVLGGLEAEEGLSAVEVVVEGEVVWVWNATVGR